MDSCALCPKHPSEISRNEDPNKVFDFFFFRGTLSAPGHPVAPSDSNGNGEGFTPNSSHCLLQRAGFLPVASVDNYT